MFQISNNDLSITFQNDPIKDVIMIYEVDQSTLDSINNCLSNNIHWSISWYHYVGTCLYVEHQHDNKYTMSIESYSNKTKKTN